MDARPRPRAKAPRAACPHACPHMPRRTAIALVIPLLSFHPAAAPAEDQPRGEAPQRQHAPRGAGDAGETHRHSAQPFSARPCCFARAPALSLPAPHTPHHFPRSLTVACRPGSPPLHPQGPYDIPDRNPKALTLSFKITKGAATGWDGKTENMLTREAPYAVKVRKRVCKRAFANCGGVFFFPRARWPARASAAPARVKMRHGLKLPHPAPSPPPPPLPCPAAGGGVSGIEARVGLQVHATRPLLI
jgi:hypothetical protein